LRDEEEEAAAEGGRAQPPKVDLVDLQQLNKCRVGLERISPFFCHRKTQDSRLE